MARGPRFAWVAPMAIFAVAFALAGCTSGPADPAHVQVRAEWQVTEPLGHADLLVRLWNDGGSSAIVGPGGHDLQVRGPTSVIPVDWGGSSGRTLAPGDALAVSFHPGLAEDGTLAFFLDHSQGVHVAPVPGPYEVCSEDTCSRTQWP